MRWLWILSAGCAAPASGDLAWTLCRAWTAWPQQDEPHGAEIRYVEPTGRVPSPFGELAGGGRIAEHAKGWAYDQALFLPDMDGDGCADLALVARRPSMCGNDTEGAIEIYSGARLTPLGEYRGPVWFSLDVSPAGEILESRTDCELDVEVGVRASLRAEPRWSRTLDVFGVRFAGDLDGDGHADVSSWAEDESRAAGGEVLLRSGRDGRLLWTAPLPSGFDMDAAPAGDWDRDGCPDLAVLSERSIAILSGRDGEPLTRGELPDGHWVDLSWASDLDGDGLPEFRCRADSAESEHWVVHSSRTWQALDVAGGWRILWCAEQGDLDGDGLDDLVLGRIHDETKERRVSVHSAAGLVDVRSVGEDELPWENLGTPDVGRFRGGEPWCVLLPVWIEREFWIGQGFTVIYPGK